MIDEPTSYCFRQSFVRRNLPRSPAALDEVNKIYKSSFNLVENSPFLCSPISKVPFYHMESGYTWKNYIFWWKLIYVLVVKNYKLCGHACMERCKKEKIIHITLGGGHKKCTFSFCSQFFRGQEVKWEVWRKCVICVTFLYCTFPNDP